MSPADGNAQVTIQVNVEALSAAFRALGQGLADTFRPIVDWFTALPQSIRDAMAARAAMDPALREALDHLDQGVQDADDEYAAALSEVRVWMDEVWGWALHHRLWAACQPGLTEDDVFDRASDMMRHRFLLNWSADDVAHIVVAMLEGWTERQAFRTLHPGAV